MRVFTLEELKQYDGRNGTSYVAFQGKVYDVSCSYHWRKGLHHVSHRAGSDLTRALEQAPHEFDLLSRFPVIGVLIADKNGPC